MHDLVLAHSVLAHSVLAYSVLAISRPVKRTRISRTHQSTRTFKYSHFQRSHMIIVERTQLSHVHIFAVIGSVIQIFRSQSAHHNDHDASTGGDSYASRLYPMKLELCCNRRLIRVAQ
jgi:hypothetical protein